MKMTSPSKAPAHSELPPSSANKWFKCHAWLTLTRALPPEMKSGTSAAAEEGTRAHTHLEEHLTGICDLSTVKEAGMFDHLMPCVEWAERTAEEEGGELHTESRVDYGEYFGYVGFTGTVDLLIESPETLVIGDLKYGKGLVEVPNNLQMMCYLVGAVHRYGPRDSYRLVILQPRGNHPQGPIREWELTHEQFLGFAKELEAAIAANLNGGKATVGPHCREYCNVLPVCPAARQHSLRLFTNTPIED